LSTSKLYIEAFVCLYIVSNLTDVTNMTHVQNAVIMCLIVDVSV